MILLYLWDLKERYFNLLLFLLFIINKNISKNNIVVVNVVFVNDMFWGLFNFFINFFVVLWLNIKKVNEVMEKFLNEGK